MDIDENTRHWLVVGICLHSITNTVLRKYVEQRLTQLYQSLKASDNIDTQIRPNQLQTFGTRYLNYEGINDNETKFGRQNQYDHKVLSAVDLSKLFIETKLSKYASFDRSCDLSAVLNIIGNVDHPDFALIRTSAVQVK